MATQQIIPYSQQNITLQYILDCAEEGKIHLFESMVSDWPFEPCDPTPQSWYAIVPTVLYLCRSIKMHEWLNKNISLFKLPNQDSSSPFEQTIKAILTAIGKFEKRDLRSCIITLKKNPELASFVFDTDYYFCEEFLFWSGLDQPLVLDIKSQKKILSDLITDTPTEPPSEIDFILKSDNDQLVSSSMKSLYKKFLKTTLAIGIDFEEANKYFKSIVCLRFFNSNSLAGFNWFIKKFPKDAWNAIISEEHIKINYNTEPALSSTFFCYWKKYLTKMIPVQCILMKLFLHCSIDTFEYLVPTHIKDEVKKFVWKSKWLVYNQYSSDLLWYLFKESGCFDDNDIAINLGPDCLTMMNLFPDVNNKKIVLLIMIFIQSLMKEHRGKYISKFGYLVHLIATDKVDAPIALTMLPHFSTLGVCNFQTYNSIVIRSSTLDLVWSYLDTDQINFWDSRFVQQNHETWTILKKRGITFDEKQSAWSECSTKEDLIWLFENQYPYSHSKSIVTIVQKIEKLNMFDEGLKYLQSSMCEKSETEIMSIRNACLPFLSKFNLERVYSLLRTKKRPFHSD